MRDRSLLLILVASAITMVTAATYDSRLASALAAALAAATIAGAALADRRSASLSFGRSALLCAATYAWGGSAMLGVYLLSGLKWQHGWQYGSAMLLIASGLLAYARTPRPDGRTLLWLTLAHGAAAATALVFLATSGKLWADKPDWAANQIFLAGGLAIMAICALSVAAQWARTPSMGDQG